MEAPALLRALISGIEPVGWPGPLVIPLAGWVAAYRSDDPGFKQEQNHGTHLQRPLPQNTNGGR